MLRVVLAGASGRTGREVGRAIVAAPDCALVGALGARSVGRDVGEVLGLPPLGLVVARELAQAGAEAGVVLVDFSRADAARELVPAALRRGMPAVVGTTGLDQDDLASFEAGDDAAQGGRTPHRNQDAGGIGLAPKDVVSDGEEFAGPAQEHLLVGNQAGKAHRVHRHARAARALAEIARERGGRARWAVPLVAAV